jgi:hypothetical protein
MKKTDHQLIQDVLDGDISRDAFNGFQQRMRAEPELFRLYGDYALLNHTLHEEFEGGQSVGDKVSASRGVHALLAIASLCILLAGLWWWFRPHLTQATMDDAAMATFSLDSVWRVEGKSRNIGGATGLAKNASVHLEQGRTIISLEPSITAVIEGPATVTLRSEKELHLASGRGWFKCGANSSGLRVTTPKLTAVDSGTVFGVLSAPEGVDEVHVESGTVRVTSTTGGDTITLNEGLAARVTASGMTEQIPANPSGFSTSLGRFTSVVSGPFEKNHWTVLHGNSAITGQRIEGANYTIFMKLAQELPSGDATVVLATLDLGKSTEGEFHTDGWAGMSFFHNDIEVLFFGDSFGTKPTWSLDVKQRIPVILPKQPVSGPQEITLRYDLRSGEVSLHEGGLPLAAPFCSGKLPPGTRFNGIRLGASAGAALAVDALHIRMGGG